MDLFDTLPASRPADSPHKGAHKKAREKASPPAGGAPAPCEPVSTVMVALPPAGDPTICRALKVGDECVYWSLYSGHFLAKVMAVRSVFGQVDVDVFSDGGLRLLHRTRVPLVAKAAAHPESVYVGERPKQ